MYLKRVEIFGFKSFADKTVLNFEPGITAVVGPNGCGKSNVFDAIRWVLGEQSMKELRGSSKEDVIFSGTNSRAPLNFAEVSLTFSNENKTFPVEYEEVTVSRRLFRSGESEYLLNKTPVRLKDILELLMGTGVGAEAYSLVQQGKVDLVVSAKPEDRRMIFDEAAGITKYKSKKREAMNKLADTENNLLRSNDIIVEVKRQIASIERQAKKAQKYKEEYERLKVLEFFTAQKQVNGFAQERQDLENSLKSYGEEERLLTEESEKINHQLSQENQLMSELDEKGNELKREKIKVENQIEIESRQIHFNEERIATIDANHLRFREQRGQLQERCQSQEEKIAGLKASYQALIYNIQRNTEGLSAKNEALQKLQEEIRCHKESIKKEEEEILERSARQVQFKNELTEIMKTFQGALARKRRLDLENDKTSSEKENIDNKLRSVSEDLDLCAQRVFDLKSKKEAQEKALGQLQETMVGLDKTISDLENLSLALKSKREFIEEMHVQYEDGTTQASNGVLITSAPPCEEIRGIIGKIKGVQILNDSPFKGVAEQLSGVSGQSLYQVSCETKFIELDPEQITKKINELALTIALRLDEKKAVALEIADCENQISRLNFSIHEQERELSKHDERKKTIVEESSKLSDELTLITQELEEAKDLLVGLKERDDSLNQELATVNNEIEGFQASIKSRQDDIAAKAQEKENVLVEVTQIETELAGFRGQEKSQQDDLKMFELALVQSQEEINRLEQDDAQGQLKKEEYKAAIETLKQKIEELQVKKNSFDEVFRSYDEQKEEILKRVAEIRSKIRQAEESLETIRENMHSRDLKRQEISFAEQSLKDRLMQTYKIDLDEIVNYREPDLILDEVVIPESVGSDLSNEQFVQERKHQEEVKEFYTRVNTMRPEVNFEALDTETQRLRKMCDSFGTVNLVAIEEYEELRQRFEFLTKQQSDLLTAKDTLMQTITKINKTTRQLFIDTFTNVRDEFKVYFKMLFGGGEADLILVDPENVLESGIDIVARPPGKKLQNITLLSGGEKTMAAIALIFAVFKVRPSPFCVLDEIDAALDESNVGRYSYLLQEFSKIAQFIVITHNKKTISAANVMYGVTMQERGVSKIVSVKLSDDEKPAPKVEQVAAAV